MAIQQGDEQAFSQLFNKHYSSLYCYVSNYGVRNEGAQDIVQQSFIYLWDHRVRIEPNKSLKAYLYTTAHIRVLNTLRDNKELAASDREELFEDSSIVADTDSFDRLHSDSIEFTSPLDKTL